MFVSEIKTYKNWLLALSFFILFGSLSVSKGFSTVSEISILILSLDKILKKSIFTQIWNNKTLFLFSTFFLFLIIGLLWSENVVAGIKIIRHQHRWMVVPLIFMVNIPFLKENYKKLLLTFVITTSVAALFVIILSFLPQSTVILISENIPLLQEYPKTMDRFAFGMYSPFVDRLQFSNLIGLASIAILFLLINKI